MKAKDEYVITGPFHLGSGEAGRDRAAALESMADLAGCRWGGRPSVGRWLIALADFFREHRRPPNAGELSVEE